MSYLSLVCDAAVLEMDLMTELPAVLRSSCDHLLSSNSVG